MFAQSGWAQLSPGTRSQDLQGKKPMTGPCRKAMLPAPPPLQDHLGRGLGGRLCSLSGASGGRGAKL